MNPETILPFAAFIALVAFSWALHYWVKTRRMQSLRLVADKHQLQYLERNLVDFPTRMLDVLDGWDQAAECLRRKSRRRLPVVVRSQTGMGKTSLYANHRRPALRRHRSRTPGQSPSTDFSSAERTMAGHNTLPPLIRKHRRHDSRNHR